jgi:hypothetical protein
MKRKLTFKHLPLFIFSLFAGIANAQTSVVIGPTTGSSTYTYGPYYRNTATSTTNYSRYAYLYTAAELNIPMGATITKIEWYKASGTISGNNTFSIWLDNSTATSLGTASTSWSTLLGTAAQVYTSSTQAFSVTGPGYESFPLTGTPFVYNGVSLKILTDHIKAGTASGANNFYNVAATGMSLGYASATAPTNTSNLTTTYGGNRPTIKITYTGGTNCSAVTFPTSANAKSNITTFCITGGSVNLSIDSTMPNVLGITYQWQSSANNTLWGNLGLAQATPGYTTAVSASTYYRCLVLCNNTSTVLTTSPVLVTVNNPGTVTGTGASHCGPSAVTLTATPSIPGTTLHWYTVATGGAPIGTGSPWTTPFLPVTTNFYVAAEVNSPVTTNIGTGTLTNGNTGYPSPFAQYYTGDHQQYIIRSAELVAAGLSAGNITSLSFDIANAIPSVTTATGYVAPLQQFQILMANTNQNAFASTTLITGAPIAIGGFTTVLPASTITLPYGTTGYIPPITFTTPFTWDGTSNVVIDISFNNAGPSPGCSTTLSYSANANVRQTATSYQSCMHLSEDESCDINSMNPDYTNIFEFGTSSQRPNMKFTGVGTCGSPRVAVIGTITPSPAVTITKPAVICSGEIGNVVTVSSPMTNYTNYSWAANVTDLYINPTATTPYTSGSFPNVYLKSTTQGQHTLYLFSSGSTAAACTHADTINIWVQPDSIKISGAPDSICVSGTSTLSLVPATGYAPNSIRWEESADGTFFNGIIGATGTTYTTPTLTSNHYYRAIIAATNDTCELPVKLVVVVNPQLLQYTDSFNCGPGTVTLKAQTGGNSVARWYDVPTGGTAIGAGSPWVTPYLASSQTYYVAAEGGGSAGPVQLGTGTNSSGGAAFDVGPFSVYDRRDVLQFLYTAADLVAAGLTPGNIKSLAFNCTSLPIYATPNYTISIKFVPSTMTTLTWQTGLNQVYTLPSFMPVVGWNTFQFNVNQFWNGSTGIVVQVCHSQVQPGYDASGNHQYTTKTGRFLYNGSDAAGSSCGVTGSSTATTLPNIKFALAPCQTPRVPVNAFIYPKPVVDLGTDINKCVDAGASVVLDAGVQPNAASFSWDDYSTSQVRAVNTGGTYYVKVTNSYTCATTDSIHVVLRKNPIVNLGNDTSVCNGASLTLDPGNVGTQYFWNTGQTSESIVVNSEGSYNVFVTNTQGCYSADTIQVSMNGELPTVTGIQITNNGLFTFRFSAVNPLNVIGYEWDFGDTTAHSYEQSPTHTYANAGNYVVVLRLSSTCGFTSDSTSSHIVGIHQINVSNDELSLYPNPATNKTSIVVKGNFKMEQVAVYNVLGQIVYKQKADSANKHELNLSTLMSGIYTVEIFTDKGTVSRKLEVLK